MEIEIGGREEVGVKKTMSSINCKSRNAKMSLEDYLQYVESQSYSDFSINYLNQIIAMHGYKKIHKTPKVVLTSAMSSIVLMTATRSTLNERISPSESESTLESIVKDLNDLNWQECSISSVEAISPVNRMSVTTAAVSASSGRQAASKKRRAKKPKEETMRRALMPMENPVACASDGVERSKRALKKKKKKKCGCSGCASHGACSFAT